jgi:hypothetical protein
MLQKLRARLVTIDNTLEMLPRNEHLLLVIGLAAVGVLGVIFSPLVLHLIQLVGLVAGGAAVYCGWRLGLREEE